MILCYAHIALMLLMIGTLVYVIKKNIQDSFLIPIYKRVFEERMKERKNRNGGDKA